ncbi:MAG: hypothetical protein K0R29_2157 [Pseudobdellovibrio sp.]|nr:hypothetical protein [Pseudobdellovibrio sp.]
MVQFTNCSKYKQPVVEAGSAGSGGVGSYSLEEDPLLNFVSTGDICEDDLQKLFLGGYYKMSRVNCAGCHMKDADKPQFASMDYNWAFTVFKSKGYEKISNNAISTTHKPPATGLHLLAEVTELKSEYKKGLELYNVCKGLPKEGVVTDPNILTTIQTVSKSIPELDIDESFDMIWDITRDLQQLKPDLVMPNFGSAGKLKITVTHRKTSSGEEYYTLKSPRIYGNSTGVIVKGLHVKLNGRFVNQQTTFKYLTSSIAANTAATDEMSLLASGAMVLLGRPTTSDYINLAFEVLKDGVVPPPPPPSLVRFKIDGQALKSNVIIIDPANAQTVYQPKLTIEAVGAVQRPIVVSVTDVTSNICGQTNVTSSFTVSSTCLPDVNNALNAVAATNTPANKKFYTARSIVGAGYNRYDWDFRMVSDQLNLQSSVDAAGNFSLNPSGQVEIKFSKDVRKEDGNRVLRLNLQLSTSNGTLTGAGALSTIYVVFLKVNNPDPGYDVTYSGLMNPISGILGTKCIKCHNSVQFNGGYDITDYDQMISRRILIPFDSMSLMFRRTNSQDPINEGLSPMPANGGLDDLTERPKIREWIINGAKNN